MSEKIELNKTVFDKNQYSQLVNTEFSSIGAPQTPQESLEDQPTVDDYFLRGPGKNIAELMAKENNVKNITKMFFLRTVQYL